LTDRAGTASPGGQGTGRRGEVHLPASVATVLAIGLYAALPIGSSCLQELERVRSFHFLGTETACDSQRLVARLSRRYLSADRWGSQADVLRAGVA